MNKTKFYAVLTAKRKQLDPDTKKSVPVKKDFIVGLIQPMRINARNEAEAIAKRSKMNLSGIYLYK